MTELGATLAVVGIGVLLALPTLPALGRWGYAVLVVPVGFAGYTLVGAGLITVGVFSSTGALAVAGAVGALAAFAWWLRSESRPLLNWSEALVAVAVVAGAAVGLAAVTDALNATRLTPDSMWYVTIAGALERAGSLDPIGPAALVDRLVGASLLHTPGVGGAGYMETWTPLLGGSGVALTAWLGRRALAVAAAPPRWAGWILVSLLALLITTNRVLYNLFYINSHMAVATFLVLGVGGAWWAAVSRKWIMLLPAGLGFAVLPLFRPEGVVVVVMFLVALIVDDRLSMRHRWALVLPVVAVTMLWHGLAVPPRANLADLGIAGPVLGNLWLAAGLVALVALTGVSRLRRLTRWVPVAMPLLLGAYVALRAFRGFSTLEESISATATNLARDGLWGVFWWVAPVLFVVAVVVVRLPLQRAFVYPLAAWPLALLFFAYERGGGYRVGAGDSGNRMMMHVALVLVLYLIAASGVGARLLAAEGPVSGGDEE